MRPALLLFASLAGCSTETPATPHVEPLTSEWRVVHRCESGCYEGWRADLPDAMTMTGGDVSLWRCGETGSTETTLDALEVEATEVGITWKWSHRGASFTAYAIEYPACE